MTIIETIAELICWAVFYAGFGVWVAIACGA
jgi:hypothetical protein